MNAIMAREVSFSSSSSAPVAGSTWWDHLLFANNSASSAWSATMPHRWPPPPSNRRSDAASSSADEPSVVDQNHHQLWNQLLLAENGGDQNSQVVDDDGENFLRVLSSKRVNNSNWPPELLPPSSSSSSLKYLLEGHLGDHSYGSRAENYNNIPDRVSNWSLAPPSSTSHLQPSTCNDDSAHNICHSAPLTTKYEAHLPAQLSSLSSSFDPMINDHSESLGMRRDSQMTIPWFDGTSNYLQRQMPSELMQASPATTKPPARGKCSQLLLDGHHKQGCQSSSSVPMKGDNGTKFEGLKKKRSEESSEMHLIKKKKYDSSMVSSNNKLQVPKVKMAEKISALQQLVSPFGKTDQASVLIETINSIKVLQEQVQLLSDPYLKSGVTKEQNPWGEVVEMRKEKDGANYDLRSRGLCLVPVSSIPQVHRESCRPDYWMPTFRSCFYR